MNFSALDTPRLVPGAAASSAASVPAARRPSRRGGGTLGIAWLHGSLEIVIFSGLSPKDSWKSPGIVVSLEQFEAALDEGLSALGFAGGEAFLILGHDEFVHRMESVPPISDEAAQSFLRARVARHEKTAGRCVWVSQPAHAKGAEASHVLHLLPAAFYDRLSQGLLARDLDLTRVVPLTVPLQAQLEAVPAARDAYILLAVRTEGATSIIVGSSGGRLAFARTFSASWDEDADRVGVEINRSLLYAKQKLGTVVEHIRLLGDDKETQQIRSRCGSGKTVEEGAARTLDWLAAVASLPSKNPVNMALGRLKARRRQRLVRTSLGTVAWLAVTLLAASTWSQTESWRVERRMLAGLRTHEDTLKASREHLLQRNREIERERVFVQQAGDLGPSPLAERSLAYMGAILPKSVRLSEYRTEMDPGTGAWSFELLGVIGGDEEGGRPVLAGIRKQLEQGPLQARFRDAGRIDVRTAGGAAAPGTESVGFNLGGTLLEK
jgi:hypothetical protein